MTCDGCDSAHELICPGSCSTSFNKPVADTYWSVSENVTFYTLEQKVKF